MIQPAENLPPQPPPTRGPIRRPPPREPVFNVPPVLVWLLAALWLVHVVRVYALPYRLDMAVVIETAFIPYRYSVPFDQQTLAWLWSPVTYSFLHGGFVHILVNSVWMLAFGAVVARRLGPARFLALWVATSAAGAFAFLALNWGEAVPVVGASGVVSGLMGAAARFAFPSSGRFRREDAHFLPRVGVLEALSNRTVAAYVGIWFAINIVTALGVTAGGEAGQAIAWEAHIGGFLCGFVLFALFDRRAWT